MAIWIVVFGAFFMLWFSGLLSAALDNFVTVRQMQSRGILFAKGIPFSGHLCNMLCDLLPFPALAATWITQYGYQWKSWQINVMTAISFVGSIILHITYIEYGKKFPEFMTYGGRLTEAGWIHSIYMTFGFAVILLAYLCTSHPAPLLVWATTIYLIIHVTIGVHIIYKIWTPSWFPRHGIWDFGTIFPIVGSAIALISMSIFALRK